MKTGLPRPKGFVSRVRRVVAELGDFILFAFRRYQADGMGQAAGALTYSTLLALVPLLVITFAILSGFPAFDVVRDRMQDMFLGALVPETGAGVQDYLSDFTRNASELTAAGIVALAVTAVLLLSTIEATLNRVWRVERPRPIGIRLLIFWTILTLGPLLLGASFVVTTDVFADARGWAGIGDVRVGSRFGAVRDTAVATFAQSALFTLIFMLVPARPVRFRDAAIGGVIAGVAFQLLRWGFNSFLTSGSTYETIYGAVAVFPIFLIWIYASWTVIIYGAVFAASFPDWWLTRDPLPSGDLSPARRLEIAVALLSVLLHKARVGGTVAQVELQGAAPLEGRDDIVEALISADYVVMTDDDELSLSRDLYATSVRDLARDLGLSLGLADDDGEGGAGAIALAEISERTGELPALLRRLDQSESEILGHSVAEVLDRRDPPPREIRAVQGSVPSG